MSDIKKTVTFVDSVEVVDHAGAIEFEAAAGDTVDLPAPSANRWIRRGKAVAGKAAKPAKNEKPAPENKKPARQAPLTAVDGPKKTSTVKAKPSATAKKTSNKKQAD
jgi:hypothetical protein